MSGPQESRGVAAVGRPPTLHAGQGGATADGPGPKSAVVPADPVIEGELVDDDHDRRRHQQQQGISLLLPTGGAPARRDSAVCSASTTKLGAQVVGDRQAEHLIRGCVSTVPRTYGHTAPRRL